MNALHVLTTKQPAVTVDDRMSADEHAAYESLGRSLIWIDNRMGGDAKRIGPEG